MACLTTDGELEGKQQDPLRHYGYLVAEGWRLSKEGAVRPWERVQLIDFGGQFIGLGNWLDVSTKEKI